ncbi:MAG: hypothetical protein WAW63_04440 [Candidatus Saccharimonadales bacterium]|jgi:hypothetical protein|nr:hypothetical protein [Candidatus Saccharibacteria bacterium]
MEHLSSDPAAKSEQNPGSQSDKYYNPSFPINLPLMLAHIIKITHWVIGTPNNP